MEISAVNLIGAFGFCRHNPGNGIGALEVKAQNEDTLQVVSGNKYGSMKLHMSAQNFMGIEEMRDRTLELLHSAEPLERKTEYLERYILAMVDMQQLLEKRLRESKRQKPNTDTTAVRESELAGSVY